MTIGYHLALSPDRPTTTATTNNNADDGEHVANSSSKKPAVLFVRGWVRGPLKDLQGRVESLGTCQVIEPESLPMPPWPLRGLWWWDRNFLVLLFVFFVALWQWWKLLVYVYESEILIKGTPVERWLVVPGGMLLIAGAFAYAIRCMTAVVCRSAIMKGVQSCLKELRRHDVVLIVAYSWGGAVVSELLASSRNRQQQHNLIVGSEQQPAVLLIAPTTARVAQTGMNIDTALRITSQPPFDDAEEDDFSSHGLVHVVHGTNDSLFCPYPERWQNNNRSDTILHVLVDDHYFKERSSKRALAGILSKLLQAQLGTTSNNNNNNNNDRNLDVESTRGPFRRSESNGSCCNFVV